MTAVAPELRRRLRWVCYLLMLVAGTAGSVLGQADKSTAPVYQVAIDGMINPGTAGLLTHAIDMAQANNAAALIVRIDTPGGLLTTTRDMVSAIDQSTVPVIGYVGPSGASATSAGAFILLATHVAVMNSGTNVGASSPVSGDGSDIDGTMAKKVMNDTRAFMRSVADSRERNVEMAERFVTEAASLTAREAADNNLIDLTVSDAHQLLPALAGREIQFHGETRILALADSHIVDVSPRLADRLLKIFAHPQIAHLLLSLGFLAIYVEILSPGLAFPGIFGAIAVILGLVGIHALDANTGFLMLLILGIVLMFAEFFVTGFGVLGIGGAVAFTLGSINLFDMPATQEYQNTILWVSIGASAAIVVSTVLITRNLLPLRAPARKLDGKTGEAMVSFDYDGYVLVAGKRYPARTEQALHYGDPIEVISQAPDGQLLVRRQAGQ